MRIHFLLLALSALSLLASPAASARDGFSFQGPDGRVYTSQSAPSYCKQYYDGTYGADRLVMPQPCLNPNFVIHDKGTNPFPSIIDRPGFGDEPPVPHQRGGKAKGKGKRNEPPEAVPPPRPGRGRPVPPPPSLEEQEERELTEGAEEEFNSRKKNGPPEVVAPPSPRRKQTQRPSRSDEEEPLDDWWLPPPGEDVGKKNRPPRAVPPPRPGPRPPRPIEEPLDDWWLPPPGEGKAKKNGPPRAVPPPPPGEAVCEDPSRPGTFVRVSDWIDIADRVRKPRQTRVATNPSLLAQVRNRTADQERCRREAPSRPKPIVIGYDGLLAYDFFNYSRVKAAGRTASPLTRYGLKGGVLNGMIEHGAMRGQGVHFEYYSHGTNLMSSLTPGVRCAYELATKPYKDANGNTVYSPVIVMGHSYGGAAAHSTVETLNRLGVVVDMVVTADARQPSNPLFNMVTFGRPSNVRPDAWHNFYERSDPVRGWPVNGTRNYDVTRQAMGHLGIARSPPVRSLLQREVARMPRCKPSYSASYEEQRRSRCP